MHEVAIAQPPRAFRPSPAVPEELDYDAGERCLLWVDARGHILDCCEQAEAMFRYVRDELVGRHVSLLLPRLAGVSLLHGGIVNPTLAFQCRCGTPFRVLGRDGFMGFCTLFVNLVALPVGRSLAIIVRLNPA
jgi:hypothetical protein